MGQSVDDTAPAMASLPMKVFPAVPALPVEIAFLAPAGLLSVDQLRTIALTAETSGVDPDLVALAEGHIAEDTFYRALASSLGLTYADAPLRPAVGSSVADVIRSGVVALAGNRAGWRYLVAPRGATIRALVAASDQPTWSAGGLCLTSPSRIEALIRHDRRHEVQRVASYGLLEWNRALSAKHGLSAAQGFGLAVALSALAVSALGAPGTLSTAVDVVFLIAFGLAVMVRLIATAASGADPEGADCPRMSDRDLPIYTIIVPLYRESRVVERLIRALDALDYPAAKLDILLAVEANDYTTLATIDALRVPARYRVIMAPPGRPRTKPRALNVALQFARGAFVVIFDAEDDPQPGQLREAAFRFAADPTLACLQARLAIDNIDDHWITRLFALEYAALFHVVNPGLAALGWPIPLGGTSNHFRIADLRRVNAWDAWNVTEDIDLGIRLARFGFRVGSLASTTFEEAPNTLKAWLSQRTRWQKGWIVTLVTHTRHPIRLWRDLGTVRTTAVAALLFGTVASSLLGPLFVAILLVRLGSGTLLDTNTRTSLLWLMAGGTLMTLGIVSAVWPVLLGLRRRRLMRLAGSLVGLPIYLLLLSLAAWQAAFESIGRPYAWSKTEHGRAKRRLGSALNG